MIGAQGLRLGFIFPKFLVAPSRDRLSSFRAHRLAVRSWPVRCGWRALAGVRRLLSIFQIKLLAVH